MTKNIKIICNTIRFGDKRVFWGISWQIYDLQGYSHQSQLRKSIRSRDFLLLNIVATFSLNHKPIKNNVKTLWLSPCFSYYNFYVAKNCLKTHYLQGQTNETITNKMERLHRVAADLSQMLQYVSHPKIKQCSWS